jgi:hypothetical protein
MVYAKDTDAATKAHDPAVGGARHGRRYASLDQCLGIAQ